MSMGTVDRRKDERGGLKSGMRHNKEVKSKGCQAALLCLSPALVAYFLRYLSIPDKPLENVFKEV